MRFGAVIVLMAMASACRCGAVLTPTAPESLSAQPAALDFDSTWVGARRDLLLTITNSGGATAEHELSLTAPFIVGPAQLRLARGESAELTVTFAPTSAGRFTQVLELGDLSVVLAGEGVEVPSCVATNACATSSFDLNAGQCVEATRTAGSACTTRCVRGTCDGLTCVGALVGCDDADACTVDACSEELGCSHAPLACPAPTSPCQVAACDRAGGCRVEPADDGVLCGVDDCLSQSVSVCVAGQCLARVRPDTGRCSNRWKALGVPGRHMASQSWDPARRETLLFGGTILGNRLRGDTWSWNGTRWEQLFPPQSPAPRFGPQMATDSRRNRVVLFGGATSPSTGLDDTWEWNGSNWLLRLPPVSPPPRSRGAMAFDERRGRTVLFGGMAQPAELDDTWEWDGLTWTPVVTAHTPSPRAFHSMAWDEARQRIVMSGGHSSGDTWEFDGTDWLSVGSGPVRSHASSAWDSVNQRVTRFGGLFPVVDEMSAWDGAQWQPLTPQPRPSARGLVALSTDPLRRRLVLFGGYVGLADTWEWDGASWSEHAQRPAPTQYATLHAFGARGVVGIGSVGGALADHWEWNGAVWRQRTLTTAPPPRSSTAMTWDTVRDRLVIFSGASAPDDTWEWDGTDWFERQPLSRPLPRIGHALVFDPVHQRSVMFGGFVSATAVTDETWEWDGTNWQRRTPLVSPPARSGHAMIWDEQLQRVLLFGGTDDALNPLSDLWEWDGAAWTQRTTAGGPSRGGQWVVDPVRHVAVLWNGETWEWANGAWTQRMPSESVPASKLVWDPINERVMALESGTMWVFLP